MSWLREHKTVCLHVIGIVLAAVLLFLLYHHLNPPQTITHETQEQAETVQGIQTAAQAAQLQIDSQQAQTAAQEIKRIADSGTAPSYVTYTTVQQAPAAEKAAQEKAGANFSIVTNKDSPSKTADISNLPASTPVTLNQYNVQAYKKVLHTIEIAPDIQNKTIDEVGYTVSRKISSDGKYIGIGATYNIDEHKTMVKVSYTW